MEFKDYIDHAWKTHATDPNAVSKSFEKGIQLLNKPEQLIQLAGLIVHVQGEHLGQFSAGINLIESLKKNEFAVGEEVCAALERSNAILALSENPGYKVGPVSISEKVRIFATVAGISSSQYNADLAATYLKQALELAESSEVAQPAQKALAIAANNLACQLEEKSTLSAGEQTLMLLSAQAARISWEKAGTWLEVERAEYRLAQSYLKAGDILNSIKHANLCLTICEKNSAGPLEFFFAYEAIAAVEKKMNLELRSLPQMERFYQLLPPEDQQWCAKSLQKFRI